MQAEAVKEGRLNLNKGNYQRLNNLIRQRQWYDEMHMDMQERYDTSKTELAHCSPGQRMRPQSVPREKQKHLH